MCVCLDFVSILGLILIFKNVIFMVFYTVFFTLFFLIFQFLLLNVLSLRKTRGVAPGYDMCCINKDALLHSN